MLQLNKHFPDDIEVIVFDWGDTLMNDFRDKKGPMYLWDKIEVVDGIPNFLEKLSSKYKLYVGSNSGESDTNMMVKALERGGIDNYFSGFFASTDMVYAKPDPRFFKHIIRETNTKNFQIAMCGNDYTKDIEAAKSVGMFTLYYKICNNGIKEQDADIIFDNFDELSTIF